MPIRCIGLSFKSSPVRNKLGGAAKQIGGAETETAFIKYRLVGVRRLSSERKYRISQDWPHNVPVRRSKMMIERLNLMIWVCDDVT
jgi:hypothetical protein